MQTEQGATGEAAGGAAAAAEGPSTSAAAAQQAQQAQQKVVPYARRLLLKSLLRAIAIASYGVGSQAQRAAEADSATLYACLKVRRNGWKMHQESDRLCCAAVMLQPYVTTSSTVHLAECSLASTLLECLSLSLPLRPLPLVQTIFQRSREFGGGLFALAASVVADLIHHDPLCYRTLDEAGLPEVGGVLSACFPPPLLGCGIASNCAIMAAFD